MEENKTNEALVPETIEAETATVAPAETTEETAAPEVSESVNDAEENLKPMATAEDEVTVLVLPDTKQGVIERLREIAQTGGNVARGELEALKQVYYRLHNAEAAAARDAFVAAGGAIEEYVPEPDMDESSFKAEMALIRELRAKALEAAEQEKQKNLSRKLEIIEAIKAAAVSPDEADKQYDTIKALQNEWKEIKNVPAERATELWKNYQLYVEQFYDQLRLGHEMRAYDFKKNLEIKTHLCEAAEKLADVEDVISAFHQLQKLHQEYRETGPVAKELREEIWARFK